MGQRVIVIVGPTCSGKTYFSIQVASLLKSEIISADSRQIYKKLNIGTAKPSQADLSKIKHHLINILNPDEDYDANKFSLEAENIITNLIDEGRIPVVTVGTGLYIKALIDGMIDSANKNDELREELLQKKKQFGNEYLYEELKKIDSQSALIMLPQNWKRVIRAIEVFHTTGKPIWHHQNSQKKKSNFNFYQFGLL